jgi:hypothetical protein
VLRCVVSCLPALRLQLFKVDGTFVRMSKREHEEYIRTGEEARVDAQRTRAAGRSGGRRAHWNSRVRPHSAGRPPFCPSASNSFQVHLPSMKQYIILHKAPNKRDPSSPPLWFWTTYPGALRVCSSLNNCPALLTARCPLQYEKGRYLRVFWL